MNSDTKRLLLFSGQDSVLRDLVGKIWGSHRIEIIATDEKLIVKPREMISRVRTAEHVKLLGVACKDLEFQRYQFMLKFYLLTGRAQERVLLDEKGMRTKVSLWKYAIVDVPKFLVEIVLSTAVLIVAWIHLSALQISAGTRKDKL